MNKKGWTQADLARKAGLSTGHLSQIITGKTLYVRNATLEKIASVLGVTVSELKGERPQYEEIPVFPIPILGQVPCGQPIPTPEEDIEGYIYIPLPGITAESAKQYFALRARGDSMEPRINEGDIIVFRKQDVVENGRLALLELNGEVAVKKVYYSDHGGTLVSLNDKYPPITFSNRDQLRIIGKVVGRWEDL